jgi:hypothetical protein
LVTVTDLSAAGVSVSVTLSETSKRQSAIDVRSRNTTFAFRPRHPAQGPYPPYAAKEWPSQLMTSS